MKVTRGTSAVTAYPVPGALACGAGGVAPVREPYAHLERGRYGALYVVDVGRGRVRRIGDRRACERLGPLLAVASLR